MVEPMKYRELVKLLAAAGFIPSEGKGDHQKWSAPGLERPVITTKTREVSPGLTRKALKAIEEVEGMQK